MEQEEIKDNFRSVFRKLDQHGNRLTAIETGSTIVQSSNDEKVKSMSQKLERQESRIRDLEDRQTRVAVKLSLIGAGIYLVISIFSKWILAQL